MPDDDQNKAIADRAAADAKAQRKSREQQLKDERDASEAATKEQQERVSNLRPTPTQWKILTARKTMVRQKSARFQHPKAQLAPRTVRSRRSNLS
jgi:hypothetical protein